LDGGAWVNKATRYLGTWLDPEVEGRPLAVIRMKAPSHSPDNAAIVHGTFQVRYWSLCVMQFQDLWYTLACPCDEELHRDPDDPEQVTVVFSHEIPQGVCSLFERVPSPPSCRYNWLPYGSSMPLLYMRHLLADQELFPESQFFFSGGSDDYAMEELIAALEEHMGEYYPRGTYCTAEQLEADRCGL
jgi:hypothetical protein